MKALFLLHLAVVLQLAAPLHAKEPDVNLSLAQHAGIPSASDSIDGSYNYLAHAFADAKPETGWITGRDMREHWARIQWRNTAVTVNRIEIDFTPITLAYAPPKDFFEKEPPPSRNLTTLKPEALELEVHTEGRWQTVQAANQPVSWQSKNLAVITPKTPLTNVRELRLKLRNRNPDDLFAVREIGVWGPKAATSLAMRPKWKGFWIWGEPDPILANFGVVKRYFRRLFKVKDPAEIRSARLLFVAHDRGRVFLNGTEVVRTADPGRAMRRELARKNLDLALLKPGKNLLAIMAEDVEEVGLRGVLAELWLEKTNGAFETIVTDADTFRASTSDEPEWNTSLEPFNHWSKANALGIPNHEIESGWSQEFTPPYFSDSVRITAVSLTPSIPKPGDKFTLVVQVQVTQPLKENYGLLVRYGESGPARNSCMDFNLGDGFVRPEAGLPQGFTGEKKLTLNGVWPDGTPPRLPLILRICNGNGQAELLKGPIGEITPGENPGGLRVAVGAPPVAYRQKGFPDARIVDGGRLAVDGQVVAPIIFTSSIQTPDRYQAWLKSGVRIFRIVPQGSGSVIPGEGDEEVHFARLIESITTQVTAIHAMDPEAKFILMLDIDMPNDWKEAHPEELIVMSNNERVMPLDPNNHTLGYLQETPNGQVVLRRMRYCLTQFVKRLEAQPYAHSILGFSLCHGRAGENYWGIDVNMSQDDHGDWIIPDRFKYVIGDVGLAARRSLRDWLRVRYKTKEALAKAWKVEGMDFEDVVNCTKWSNRKILERLMWHQRPKDRFMFRDEIEEGSFYHDFIQHQNEARAELFIEAGKAIKEASGGKLLVQGYIGYVVPNLTNSPPGAAQHSGHTATRLIFESPYLDYLVSPHFYHLRRAGDPVMAMSTVDSLRLHGKLWVNEFDSRTYLSPIDPKTYSQTETLEVFKKEFGYAITKDQGWWWLEFPFALVGKMAPAWFADDKLIRDVAIMKRVYDRYLTLPYAGPSAECAVILNVEQPYYTDAYSPANTVHSAVCNFLIPRLFKLGPSFDLYSQTDLPKLVEKGWHKRYKLMLFVNSFHLSKAERALIDTQLKQDGRTLAFFFAPGYQGNENPKSERALEGIESITGLKGVARLDESKVLGLTLDEQNPAFKECTNRSFDVLPWWGPEQIDNYHQEIGPVFYLDSSKANGWTRLANLRLNQEEQKDKTALALLKTKDCKVFYSALPDLSMDALNVMLKESGVHCYTPKPGVLTWSNPYLLCVHAPRAEKGLVLTAKGKVNWIEPFEQKVYGKQTDRITIDLERGQTKFFCLEKNQEWESFAK